MHRTRTPCLPSAIVIDGLRSRCAGHLAIYFPLPVFFAPTRRTNSAVVIYPRNKGASEQVAQCAMASAFDSGMGFMGIFLPRGVIHHSISSPQPRQMASLSNRYPCAFISIIFFGNPITSPRKKNHSLAAALAQLNRRGYVAATEYPLQITCLLKAISVQAVVAFRVVPEEPA